MFSIRLSVYFLLHLCGNFFAQVQPQHGCSITLPTDLPSSEPVLLFATSGSTSFELFKPIGEVTNLPVDSKLLLLCTGRGNQLTALVQESLELKCAANGAFTATSTNTEYKLNQLACQSIPTSSLLLTSERCGNNKGYIFKAGFDHHNGADFATVFKICSDNTTEHTLYTYNIINGAAIDYKIIEGTRRAFRADGMRFTTTVANTYYTTNNQIARFKDYFGNNQPYITTTMYLARGHLSPDADFVFSYEQLATYFYTNVAPEFQVINAGNWIRVENLARSLASIYGDDLDIYTGVMGHLELPHPVNNQNVPIYLDDGHFIEVPKFYFKVIKHNLTDAAIVMVTLNNPFATSTANVEFCTNVCKRAGVHVAEFEDAGRGYTFCCEYDDFKSHYADLPAELSASSLLVDPNRAEVRPEEEEDEQAAEPVVQGCSTLMPTDIPNLEPVYFVSTTTDPLLQLYKPKGEFNLLPIDTNLTLVCSGSGNNLELLNQQSLVLTCNKEGNFYSAEKSRTFTLKELHCNRIPTSEVKTTAESCGDGRGYIFHAGYEFGAHFGSVFQVCYDNTTESTIYARNIINGATINYNIKESTRRAFRANGMQLTTTATNTYYTIASQIQRFESYFGNNQFYINSTMYMARGHLAPDADFVFSYEQLATYFYVNVAPEFQVINAGNWKRVENAARSMASNFGSDLLTFTGVLDQLKLPDSSNTMIPIFLDANNVISVSKWFYKVLMHPQLDTSLVLITSNNPFADASEVKPFCSNVCVQYGLDSAFFNEIGRGYTFCCTLRDFQESVAKLLHFDLPEGWNKCKENCVHI